MSSSADFTSHRLYEADRHLGLRLVRLVSRAEGERLERAGTAEAGVDRDGATLCYCLKHDPYAAKPRNSFSVFNGAVPALASSQPTSAVFSAGEVQALAGTKFKHGRSLTARMTEEQRANRIHRKSGRKLRPEDLVERATNKMKAWEHLRAEFRRGVTHVAIPAA